MIIILLISFIMLLFYIIKKVYAKFWDDKLNIDISFSKNYVNEGDRLSIVEVIINDKMIPLPILEVFFNLDKSIKYVDMSNSSLTDKLYRRDVFTVFVKRKISRSFDIICNNRGYFTLLKFEAMAYDLFMTHKFFGDYSEFKELYVFPRKIKNSKILLPYKHVMGDLTVRKNLYEDPFSFAGIRDYTPTDSMNTINWKASAKSQQLVVNMFDSSINQNVVIILDTFKNENNSEIKLNEEAIRIASSLCEKLFAVGVQISLLGNGKDVVSGEVLNLVDLKGLGISIVNQNLARLDLGDELPIDYVISNVLTDCYVVVISKNVEIQNALPEKDFLWIVPYNYEVPQILIDKKNCMLWECS